LRINANGQVLDLVDKPIRASMRCELVGGIFYQNYLGGAGLMQGRLRAPLRRSAGRHARS